MDKEDLHCISGGGGEAKDVYLYVPVRGFSLF